MELSRSSMKVKKSSAQQNLKTLSNDRAGCIGNYDAKCLLFGVDGVL